MYPCYQEEGRKEEIKFKKKQKILDKTLNQMKKAYVIRKDAIRQRFLNDDVVKFYESDNHMSFAAFNILYYDVWQFVAEVVIAHEDANESDLDIALRNAAAEKRINLGKLLLMLK